MAEIIQAEGKQKGGKKKAKKFSTHIDMTPHGRPDVFAYYLFYAYHSICQAKSNGNHYAREER